MRDRISEEGKVRMIVVAIVAMLAVTMVVAGWQQTEANNFPLDRTINAQEGTGLSEDDDEVSERYTSRDPIRIDGNEDFAEKAEENGWPGDGSQDDPYVIEGYEIDGGGYESGYRANGRYEYGIYIGNVTEHFVIQECYIHNVTIISENMWLDDHHHDTQTPPGIFLHNSQNGRIEKNEIYSSIALSGSSYNVITNNIIRSVNFSSFDGHGITIIPSSFDPVENSVYNDIRNNTISNKTIGITIIYYSVHGESNPGENNIENNTFNNIEKEIEEQWAVEDGGCNNDDDSWFQTRSFFYSVVLLGISVVILGVGWRRVKGSGKNER